MLLPVISTYRGPCCDAASVAIPSRLPQAADVSSTSGLSLPITGGASREECVMPNEVSYVLDVLPVVLFVARLLVERRRDRLRPSCGSTVQVSRKRDDSVDDEDRGPCPGCGGQGKTLVE